MEVPRLFITSRKSDQRKKRKGRRKEKRTQSRRVIRFRQKNIPERKS
jgi:hypothetical protein